MDEAATRFVERLGLQVEGEGFPRIAGRMIGYLLLQDEPSSLDELAEKLQVSKASVSTNARALEDMGFVERRSVPGDRRDYYMIVDEPWGVLLERVRRQLSSRVEILEEAVETLPPGMEAGRRRVAAWRDYYMNLVDQIDWWAEHQGTGARVAARGGRGRIEERR